MAIKKKKDYQLIVGVCKDEGVIIDITYNGILNNLTNDDLEDVLRRLNILRKDVKSLLWCRLWAAIKEYFRRK